MLVIKRDLIVKIQNVLFIPFVLGQKLNFQSYKNNKNSYQYKHPGLHNPSGYDLYSLGKDSTEGTGDDIGNWE